MVDLALQGAARKATAGILPLEVAGLCYEAQGRRLLRDVSFRIEQGSRTVVLGPNGAGKSLLLRLCHGLLEPSGGAVRWLGPAAASPAKRQAMVFQRPVLLRRSALGNVTYGLALHGVPRAERTARALESLERTGLAPLAGRAARVLSAGEQQRLALARAWALQPEVLFLDEPTASLDPAASRAVEEIIRAVHAAGTTIVMTTHDLGLARRQAGEVLFLHQGRLLECGTASSVFDSPTSAEARAFLRGELLW